MIRQAFTTHPNHRLFHYLSHPLTHPPSTYSLTSSLTSHIMQLLEPSHFSTAPYYHHHKDDSQPGSPLTRSPSPQPLSRRIRPTPSITPIADGYRPSLALLATRERSFTVPTPNQHDSAWASIREEVVAWFIDICAELSLSQPVVAIAANIFDRFAALSQPPRELAAALAAACLLIASKVAEDDTPSAEYLARRVRLRSRHLADAEAAVLSALDWRVNVVTPHEVARELLDALGGAQKLPTRALHELETLALAAALENDLIGVPPTIIATAAVAAALESVPRSDDVHETYRLATLRVNTFVLARDSGYDVGSVDAILPVLRGSMRRIIDAELVDDDDETEQWLLRRHCLFYSPRFAYIKVSRLTIPTQHTLLQLLPSAKFHLIFVAPHTLKIFAIHFVSAPLLLTAVQWYWTVQYSTVQRTWEELNYTAVPPERLHHAWHLHLLFLSPIRLVSPFTTQVPLLYPIRPVHATSSLSSSRAGMQHTTTHPPHTFPIVRRIDEMAEIDAWARARARECVQERWMQYKCKKDLGRFLVSVLYSTVYSKATIASHCRNVVNASMRTRQDVRR